MCVKRKFFLIKKIKIRFPDMKKSKKPQKYKKCPPKKIPE